jgi:hypothetical protein
MGLSVSKSPVPTSTVTIPKEVGIEENPAFKAKEDKIVPFNLSLAKMVNKVTNKLASLPDDTESLEKMINDYSEKSETLKLPDMLVKNKLGFYDQTQKNKELILL